MQRRLGNVAFIQGGACARIEIRTLLLRKKIVSYVGVPESGLDTKIACTGCQKETLAGEIRRRVASKDLRGSHGKGDFT